MKEKFWSILLMGSVLVIFAPSIHAQDVRVKGTVIAASDGQPLPGVNIIIKGTSQGTSTNADGVFELDVSSLTDTLLFSFVGYQTQVIPLNGQSDLEIQMQLQAISGGEVVVVGYGTQEKENLTGSISTQRTELIENRPLTNSSQAIQGVNGVYVNQASGQPGADGATLRIRGVGTLGDSDPLVLVDGVEYNLSDVNPSDIENISVLKDAAAASIYGNRAANGVVLITTKGGQKGQNLQVDYNYYYGFQDATFLPDMAGALDYMEARNQASINEGVALAYSEEEVEEYRNGIGTNDDLYPDNDWFDIMFDRAAMQEHNLRLHGGGEQAAYSVSLGYLDQDGIMLGSNAQKYSLNSNVQFDVTDRLTLGTKVSGTFWDKNEPPSTADRMMDRIARALPIQPNILSDGRYGDTWLTTPGHNVFRHPVAMNTEGFRKDEDLRLLGNITAEYRLPLDIEYNLNIGVNYLDGFRSIFEPDIFYHDVKNNRTRRILFNDRNAYRRNNNQLNTTLFNTFSWRGDITERSTFNVLVGFSRETFSNETVQARREGFFGNNLYDLNAGSTNDYARSLSSESALMSYFGRVHYSFADRYLLEFNFRYDGSSRFAKGNRWGFFPSFSAAWRIDQETFMQNMNFLDEFKLRASWGELGNQNIPLFSYVNKVNLGQQAVFNDSEAAGAAVTSIADPDISWEKTTIANLGLDVGLFEHKLELTVDVFDKQTDDILTRVNVPAQVGNLEGPVTNLYGMKNKGLEIGANHRNVVNMDLNYSLGASIAFVSNEVTFLDGDVQLGNNTLWGPMNIIQEGHPVNSYFLLDALGIFRAQAEIDNYIGPEGTLIQPNAQPGDLKYRDVNGDGAITSDDRIIAGRTVPEYTYSFNFQLNYKRFDLGVFIQGVQGVDTYPRHNTAYPVMNGAGITVEQLDYWSPENPDAAFPRIGLPRRGSQVNYQLSTFWLQDASYLRLKNLQIGYTIPAERINLRKLRIYANAQNLLTFSNYTLTDPEREITQGTINTYPTSSTVSLGINIGF